MSLYIARVSGDPAAPDSHQERAHKQWTAESEQSYAAMSEEEERRQRRVDVRAIWILLPHVVWIGFCRPVVTLHFIRRLLTSSACTPCADGLRTRERNQARARACSRGEGAAEGVGGCQAEAAQGCPAQAAGGQAQSLACCRCKAWLKAADSSTELCCAIHSLQAEFDLSYKPQATTDGATCCDVAIIVSACCPSFSSAIACHRPHAKRRLHPPAPP